MSQQSQLPIAKISFAEYRAAEKSLNDAKHYFRFSFLFVVLVSLIVKPAHEAMASYYHGATSVVAIQLVLGLSWFFEVYHSDLKMRTIFKIYVENADADEVKSVIRYVNQTDFRSRYTLPYNPWLFEPFLWLVVGTLIVFL